MSQDHINDDNPMGPSREGAGRGAEAQVGRPPERYRVRIDKEHFEFDTPSVTGVEVLARAGKSSEQWRLQLRERGANYREIGPGEVVDLTSPGLERFVTIPRQQTDGAH